MEKPKAVLRTDVDLDAQLEEIFERYGDSAEAEDFAEVLKAFDNLPLWVESKLITAVLCARDKKWRKETRHFIGFLLFTEFDARLIEWIQANPQHIEKQNLCAAVRSAYASVLGTALNYIWGNEDYTPDVFVKIYSDMLETRSKYNHVDVMINKTKKDAKFPGLDDFLSSAIN